MICRAADGLNRKKGDRRDDREQDREEKRSKEWICGKQFEHAAYTFRSIMRRIVTNPTR